MAPAQALAPEIAAFRAGVFSPQPFPIEVDRAKAALMGQLQLAVQLGHRCGASAKASEDADVHGNAPALGAVNGALARSFWKPLSE